MKLFLKNVFCTAGLLIFCHILVAQPFQKLVWSDEFNKPGLPDSSKWSYDLGSNCPQNCGWGNNELQYYTKEFQNVRVENGMLVIEARKEAIDKYSYSSGRVKTQGKGDWKYGRFEIRAKVPNGRGVWPAIWMMPAASVYGKWPKSGEIDIMEHVGYKPDSLYATVHTSLFNGGNGKQKGKATSRNDLKDAYHIYALEWTERTMKFYVDDELVFEYKRSKAGYEYWPFDQEFYLILNVAIGGNWGGQKGVDDAIFPAPMLVDYVRVYQ
jgi:beta-glucanase (GH16 family)